MEYKQWVYYWLVWENPEFNRYFKGVTIYYDGIFRDINSRDEWYEDEELLKVDEL